MYDVLQNNSEYDQSHRSMYCYIALNKDMNILLIQILQN